MRGYKSLRALKEGKVVEVEGVGFKQLAGELRPGYWYVAERNTGPHLLTVKEIHEFPWGRVVYPEEPAYPFNIGECVRVEPAWGV